MYEVAILLLNNLQMFCKFYIKRIFWKFKTIFFKYFYLFLNSFKTLIFNIKIEYFIWLTFSFSFLIIISKFNYNLLICIIFLFLIKNKFNLNFYFNILEFYYYNIYKFLFKSYNLNDKHNNIYNSKLKFFKLEEFNKSYNSKVSDDNLKEIYSIIKKKSILENIIKYIYNIEFKLFLLISSLALLILIFIIIIIITIGLCETLTLAIKFNYDNFNYSDLSYNRNFLPFISLFKNNYMWIPSFLYIIYVILNYFGFNLPVINLNNIMYYISIIGIISSSIMFIFKLITFNYYLALKMNKKVKGISVLWPNFIKYQFELIRGISKINLPYKNLMLMELVFYAIMIIINSYGFFYIVI